MFFFSSRRRHTRWTGDWSSDVCSSDLQDRPGLLHDLGIGFAKAGLSVRSAHIATYAGQTLDTFYVTEFGGRLLAPATVARSEERRVGKECRSRRAPDQ